MWMADKGERQTTIIRRQTEVMQVRCFRVNKPRAHKVRDSLIIRMRKLLIFQVCKTITIYTWIKFEKALIQIEFRQSRIYAEVRLDRVAISITPKVLH